MAGQNIVDSSTGSITYKGFIEVTKGNHSNMPARTDAYMATDEKGHIQASSLSGSNHADNVVPQAADLNHGGYYSMERGERAALNNDCMIETEKIAYVSNQPGNRPDAFIVNDVVTYYDGQTQNVHLSFSNLANAEQEGMNAKSSEKAADMFNAFPNPGDTLRDSMTTAEYTTLMEETDTALPNVCDMYTEYIEVSFPAEMTGSWDYESEAGTENDATTSWDFESAAEGEMDSGTSWDCESSADPGGADDGADISSDDD